MVAHQGGSRHVPSPIHQPSAELFRGSPPCASLGVHYQPESSWGPGPGSVARIGTRAPIRHLRDLIEAVPSVQTLPPCWVNFYAISEAQPWHFSPGSSQWLRPWVLPSVKAPGVVGAAVFRAQEVWARPVFLGVDRPGPHLEKRGRWAQPACSSAHTRNLPLEPGPPWVKWPWQLGVAGRAWSPKTLERREDHKFRPNLNTETQLGGKGLGSHSGTRLLHDGSPLVYGFPGLDPSSDRLDHRIFPAADGDLELGFR